MGLRQTWGRSLAAAAKPESGSDASRHLAWQATGDKRFLESLYAAQIEASALREYINTEGSLWIDRVYVAQGELQRARLGGVALTRNAFYPGHSVSWKFHAPADEESTAILIPHATRQSLKVVAYNMTRAPVRATMTAWDIEPGRWELVQGVDRDGDDAADGETSAATLELEKTGEVALTFPPGAATVLSLKLLSKGEPYWSRPDLGIGREDVTVRGRSVTVTVHSLGATDTRPSSLVLSDRNGKVLATATVPALKAPTDLLPKTVTLTLTVPAGGRVQGGSITIDPAGATKEITRVNNRLWL